MASDHEIGRLVTVDTAQVTVELNRDLKAMTRSTYEGTLEVGRINSYIIIPVGARRIVAMVTRVFLIEESELKADKTMVTLPSSRRFMKATMIGTIDEGRFRQGISLFPVLDTPVLIATKEDLNAIFGKKADSEKPTPEEPGFCIPIGRSAIFPDYEIKIDPDAFFGKHAAIIGSTGSGKSCSIATIIQSVIKQKAVKRTKFIILDTNGEYRAAFQKANSDGKWVDAQPAFKSLYIPTDPAEKERLTIPYWFMNSDEFIRLFRASPGVQRPVLLSALSSARDSEGDSENWVRMKKDIKKDIIQECKRILGICLGTDKNAARMIRQRCDGMSIHLGKKKVIEQLDILTEHYPEVTVDKLKTKFKEVCDTVLKGISDKGGKYESYAVLDINKKDQIENVINFVLETLTRLPEKSSDLGFSSSDCPRFFSKSEFRDRHLESAMTRAGASFSQARDNCAAMLMRIYRLLEDSRFEFLFGPTYAEWPSIEHSLATFIRAILGVETCPNLGVEKCSKISPSDTKKCSKISLSDKQKCSEGQLPFYDQQRRGASRSNVVIIDLSLLASEVLENVTALIGRLIHEFMRRLTDHKVSGISRGEYPVVLVLEEAQNYIREGRKTEEDPISKQVFERIAREGRKYGLGLVVASQRPSELSKTVLSQCNSFIVHRLQNPEDLRYFREIVPSIYGQMLDQLPALAPRSTLVLGECVQAPAVAEMREANPIPKSKNPMFYKSWTQQETQPDFEAVCKKWEGKQQSCPVPDDEPHTAADNGDEME